MLGLRKFTGLFILLSFLAAKHISVFSFYTNSAIITYTDPANIGIDQDADQMANLHRYTDKDQDADRDTDRDINPDKDLGTDHDGDRGVDPDSESLPDEEKESKNTELPEDAFITEDLAGLIRHPNAQMIFTPYTVSCISSYYDSPYQPPEV